MELIPWMEILMKAVMRLILLSLWTQASAFDITLEDELREKSDEIQEFFQKYPTQYFEGAPHKEEKHLLSYKFFSYPNAKATIFIVQGYSENFHKYKELIYDFYRNGFSVAIHNARSHGTSRLVSDRRVYVEKFSHFVEDFSDFIKMIQSQQEDNKTFIFAHSMGGAIGIRILQRQLNPVDGMVLSSPMIEMNTYGIPEWLGGLFYSGMIKLGLGDWLSPGESIPGDLSFEKAGTSSELRFKRYHDLFYNPELSSWQRGGATINFVYECLLVTQKLRSLSEKSKISSPILALQAENDRWVIPEGLDRFCKDIPSCRSEVVVGARHEIYHEADQYRVSYMEKVLDFFDELRR